MEAYLTNGKMTKSNVAEFRTLIRTTDEQPTTILGAQPSTENKNDPSIYNSANTTSYYESMVAAAIVASFAILAFLIVLYFYMRRNVTYTHTINKPNSSSGGGGRLNNSYDNSSLSSASGFKVV